MTTLDFQVPSFFKPFQKDHLHLGQKNRSGHEISLNSYFIEKNGIPWLATMGEFPFSRYPSSEWETELWKIKAGGIQIVSTYVFWNHHEEDEGSFDWTGQRNLRRFIESCRKCGLYVMLRIGPFCHGEVRNGGLPDWLYGRDFELRSNETQYLKYVRRFYHEIGRQADGLMFGNDGPVIAIQCENEFMDSVAPWETTHFPAAEYTPKGSGGIEHMLALKKLAIEAGLDAPLFAATGWDSAPIVEEEFLPMFGAYAYHAWAEPPQKPTTGYLFEDKHTGNVPFATCEIGGGMQGFYKNRPVVPAASVEAMQIIYLGSGTNLLGYYVYHGGTNPIGKHSYLNEHRCPRISYDFQAPLRDFGQITESYHRLRRQFFFVNTWGHLLAPMHTVLPSNHTPSSPTDTESIRGAVRANASEGFVFLSNYQDHVEMPEKDPFQIALRLPDDREIVFPQREGMLLPPESCTILPFNFDLSGVELLHATAQPLTQVTSGNINHYFFFSSISQQVEYAFSSKNISSLDVTGGISHPIEDGFIVSMSPGIAGLIKIETTDNREIWITTLSNQESLRFWKTHFSGSEHATISDVDLLITDKDIELLHFGQLEGSIYFWPPLNRRLLCDSSEAIRQKEGVFERHDLVFRPVTVSYELRRKSDRQVVLNIPAGTLSGLDELLVSINYMGDMGTAYIDGKLVHDNFSNGLPWEIGLKRFVKPHQATQLVIRISPKPGQGPSSQLITGTMANMKTVEDKEAVASIDSIGLTPRQRLKLHLAPEASALKNSVLVPATAP